MAVKPSALLIPPSPSECPSTWAVHQSEKTGIGSWIRLPGLGAGSLEVSEIRAMERLSTGWYELGQRGVLMYQGVPARKAKAETC